MPGLRPSRTWQGRADHEGELMPKSDDKCGTAQCTQPTAVITSDGPFCARHYSQRLERKYHEAVRRLL